VTADGRSELGPRSLDPDRSFWSAFAELIWDQTSPADFCNCYCMRAKKPELTILAGTNAVTFFLFSMRHAISLARAVTHGEPR